jgi:hypothetical protein
MISPLSNRGIASGLTLVVGCNSSSRIQGTVWGQGRKRFGGSAYNDCQTLQGHPPKLHHHQSGWRRPRCRRAGVRCLGRTTFRELNE